MVMIVVWRKSNADKGMKYGDMWYRKVCGPTCKTNGEKVSRNCSERDSQMVKSVTGEEEESKRKKVALKVEKGRERSDTLERERYELL